MSDGPEFFLNAFPDHQTPSESLPKAAGDALGRAIYLP
jgi:hypothetical protein